MGDVLHKSANFHKGQDVCDSVRLESECASWSD